MISIETLVARAHSAAFRTYMVSMHAESPGGEVARAAHTVSDAVFQADMLAAEPQPAAAEAETWTSVARRVADAAEAAAVVTRCVTEAGAAVSLRADAALAADAVVPPSVQLSATRQETWERKAERTEAWAVRAAWDAFGRASAACGLPPAMVLAGMAVREGRVPLRLRTRPAPAAAGEQPAFEEAGATGPYPPVP